MPSEGPINRAAILANNITIWDIMKSLLKSNTERRAFELAPMETQKLLIAEQAPVLHLIA